MEKVIKKQKPNKIDISTCGDNEVYELDSSTDYQIIGLLDGATFEKKLRFRYTKNDLKSLIEIRLVIKGGCNIKIDAVVEMPAGIQNSESELKMNCLILDKNNRISFTPSLEINSLNSSADHHSTIGTPDVKQLQYLLSRGISYDEALGLIADSYLNDV